jgi:hypothetical protein
MNNQSDSLHIIYISESNNPNDETIKYIKKLLDAYEDKNSNFKKFSFPGQSASFEDLVNADSAVTDSVFLFGGHGTDKALWAKGEVFYDEDSFNLGPKSLFAFCCDAGSEIGKSFAEKTNGSFYGFNSFLAFDANPDFYKWMQEIFYPVISRLFHDETVSQELYTMTKNKLQEAHDYYESNASDFWIEMCLAQMIKSLCIY